ncbi:MAG TPA: GGDEF domain-containing protein [Candidatus Goldiibacteriota bacterium]|nr:GGDEF domain-containing protein [Candidatus Goldiibacteriota bacterium]
MVKISDVMMTDVLTAAKTDTILDMSKRLQAHRIGAIVIVDNNRYPVGIVSERDIIRSLGIYKEQALNKQAQDIMSSPVLTLEPDQDIETAATLMSLNMIRRIPITVNDRLAGIISYRDITNALRKNYYMLEQKTEKLEDKANHDPLTGLFNKGYMEEQLTYHFELARRSRNSMAVMFLDIDHFKKVNDTYGHQRGDEVLKRIAHILKDKSRAINVVGRFGGEEFMIIGPISDYKSALYLGERIRTAVEKEVFSHENTDFNITISIGISVWNSSIASEKDLVKFADEALYTAKRNGRNQVRMYEG